MSLQHSDDGWLSVLAECFRFATTRQDEEILAGIKRMGLIGGKVGLTQEKGCFSAAMFYVSCKTLALIA